jgi:hypothetical protein
VKGWNWCQILNGLVSARKKDNQYSDLYLPGVVFFLKVEEKQGCVWILFYDI